MLFGGTACIKARRKFGFGGGKGKIFNHLCPSCPWGASEAKGGWGCVCVSQEPWFGQGVGAGGWVVRALTPDLEDCHTWACAFTK